MRDNIPSPGGALGDSDAALTGVAETIAAAAEAEPLVRLIRARVQDSADLTGDYPLGLPALFKRFETYTRAGNVAAANLFGLQVVDAYPGARRALVELLRASAARRSAPPLGLMPVGPERPPPSQWARQTFTMTVNGKSITTVTPAPRLPAAVRDGLEGIQLAPLTQWAVPVAERTPDMARFVSLTHERVGLERGGGGGQARRAELDALLLALYPSVLEGVRRRLDTPEHMREIMLTPALSDAIARLHASVTAREAAASPEPQATPASPPPAQADTQPQPSTALVLMGPEELAAHVEQARDVLVRCHHVAEAKDLVDRAAAVRAYLRSALAAEAARVAADEIFLRARRRLGELTRELPQAPAGRKGNRSHVATHFTTPKATALSDLGISKQECSRFEQLASVPARIFEDYLRTTKAQGRSPTARGALTLLGKAQPATTPTRVAAGPDGPRTRRVLSRLRSVREDIQRLAEENERHPPASVRAGAPARWADAVRHLDEALTLLSR